MTLRKKVNERDSEQTLKIYKYMSMDSFLNYFMTNISLFFDSVENYNDPYESHYVLWTAEDKIDYKMDEILHKKDEEIRQKLFKCYKTTCFSLELNNILMWAHYADNHKGVCLEFEIEEFDKNYNLSGTEIFKNGLLENEIFKEITYNSLPLIKYYHYLQSFTDDDNKDVPFHEILTTKSSCWEYEKEWRYIIPDKNGTLKEINKKSLKSIIFGYKSDFNNIWDNYETIINTFPDIYIAKMVLQHQRYEIHPCKLIYNLKKNYLALAQTDLNIIPGLKPKNKIDPNAIDQISGDFI